MSNIILQTGAILPLLVFAHFITDWVFQTHNTAMEKHKNWRVLGFHSLIYSCLMTWTCWFLKGQPVFITTTGQILSLLFVSHFIEDTYIPVYLWMKYIRKVPLVKRREDFAEYVKTPLGCVLAITIDQIIHIIFLIPIAYILVR